jgi:hypothetical protein
MPQGEVHFENVRGVLEDFLLHEARVGFRSIQQCPFGQAYVRFSHVRDRDRMVSETPHVFDDIVVSFAKHNQGSNWRRKTLNRECWLLLVGPPLDNWSSEDITSVVCSFGRLIMWENDADNKGRILAKVRCDELVEIPKSVRFTEGEVPDAESWTFSIEVLQQVLIGDGPPAEDPMPEDGVDPHPLPIVNAGPLNVLVGNFPVDENADWEDGHWAFNNGGNVAPNDAPNADMGPAAAPNVALQIFF